MHQGVLAWGLVAPVAMALALFGCEGQKESTEKVQDPDGSPKAQKASRPDAKPVIEIGRAHV